MILIVYAGQKINFSRPVRRLQLPVVEAKDNRLLHLPYISVVAELADKSFRNGLSQPFQRILKESYALIRVVFHLIELVIKVAHTIRKTKADL